MSGTALRHGRRMATKSHVSRAAHRNRIGRHRRIRCWYRLRFIARLSCGARIQTQFCGRLQVFRTAFQNRRRTPNCEKAIMRFPGSRSHAMTNTVMSVSHTAFGGCAWRRRYNLYRPRRNRKACRSMSARRAEDQSK